LPADADLESVTDQGPLLRTEPDPAAALSVLEDGLDRGAVVVLLGRCRVAYDGRAASTLDDGERLVICKPDGATLVHTEEGQQPVNWQPPGSTQVGRLDGDDLVVESTRSTPEETLEVRFDRIDHAVAYDLTDPSELDLTGTEADLRERVIDEPSLIEDGFAVRATERETPAGAVDIFGEDGDGRTVAVELKRRRVGPDAVSQLNRYVEALDRDLHDDQAIRGILVAPSVTDRARELLAERGLDFVSLSPTGE
jgi:RecB family endonuclease NucS